MRSKSVVKHFSYSAYSDPSNLRLTEISRKLGSWKKQGMYHIRESQDWKTVFFPQIHQCSIPIILKEI
jgi:hypothetical protein